MQTTRPIATPRDMARALRRISEPLFCESVDFFASSNFMDGKTCDLASEAEPAAAASALRREERPKHAGESREVARLNKNLTGTVEFRDHPFAAQKASEK